MIVTRTRKYRDIFYSYLLPKRLTHHKVTDLCFFTALLEITKQISLIGWKRSFASLKLTRLSKKSFFGFHETWNPKCESRHSPFLARNAKGNPSSETSRPLATSSLAVGRFAAKQGSPRSPRGRLVAGLEANVLWPLFVKTTALANVRTCFKFFMFYGSEEVFISVQR